MNTVIEKIKKSKLVPVVKIDDIDKTVDVVKALSNGGLSVIEITYRTACAKEAIRTAVAYFPELVIGAGTVTSIAQAIEAVSLGAQFIVSPGFSEEIAKFCQESNILYLGGAVTPTEIMKARSLGFNIIKFFPSEAYGGIKTIKSLSAPFTDIYFMPTGGINQSNIKEYLAFDRVIACGGSWMVADGLISSCSYEKITELTQEALREIL